MLGELADRGYTVFGPVARDGAIVQDVVTAADQLPSGWRDVQSPGHYRLERREDEAVFGHVVGPHSPRRLFHLPEERLFQLRRRDEGFAVVPEVVEAPKIALLGARACDLAALAIQDRVLRDVDPRYAARRSDVIVVAVSCNEPGGTCFCASLGTGPTPTTGFDLSLTELLDPHRFVVTIGSELGAALADALKLGLASEADLTASRTLGEAAARAMGRQLDPEGLREALYEAAEHPHWNRVAERCLTCASCTLVCPTCFCSRMTDRTSLDGATAERSRSWDSCFSLDHSYMHGGVARSGGAARYRQWLTHKLATWIDQFGTSGCVGCGRCITWCPAGIDITEEAAALREEPLPPRSRRL